MILCNPRFPVRKDRIDWRDKSYNFKKTTPRRSMDLRPWASPIEDQLALGSCVGQAVVGAYELMLNRINPENFVDLSRLFVYYNARLLDGSVDKDEGAYVRDGVKSLNKWGVCAENIWPYIIDRFALAPSINAYVDGKSRIVSSYYRIHNTDDIIDSINSGFPVVVSMNVYESFDDLELPRNYFLKMPSKYEGSIGGHAVVLVGYDLDKEFFIVRNSFGKNWGLDGYFFMPIEYAKKDLLDAWTFDIAIK